jgi:hypothetical protein
MWKIIFSFSFSTAFSGFSDYLSTASIFLDILVKIFLFQSVKLFPVPFLSPLMVSAGLHISLSFEGFL